MQSRLRLIDFDDLQILRCLFFGGCVSECARVLGVTQPAVTLRMRKLEGVFDGKLIEKNGRRAVLTPHGIKVAMLANAALKILETPIQ